MAYQDTMRIEINKGKRIGQVLFVVEGPHTEPLLIYRIFTQIFGYQMDRLYRNGDYKVFKRTDDPFSRVIVINANSSNICSIAKDDEYLNNVFDLLNEQYDLDIDNAAIYYLFDRDPESNTNKDFIKNALYSLCNSRDSNPNWGRQGLLLLSYPCIEGFVGMNLLDHSIEYCWNKTISLGNELKVSLNADKLLPNHIAEDTLLHCVKELIYALELTGVDTTLSSLLDSLDDFSGNNRTVFDWEESVYLEKGQYGMLSLFAIALLDLGLIEVKE